MSVSPSTRLPEVESDYKIGTYLLVSDTKLMYINYITDEFILLEDCMTNEVESWTIDSFAKVSKQIVRKEVN